MRATPTIVPTTAPMIFPVLLSSFFLTTGVATVSVTGVSSAGFLITSGGSTVGYSTSGRYSDGITIGNGSLITVITIGSKPGAATLPPLIIETGAGGVVSAFCVGVAAGFFVSIGRIGLLTVTAYVTSKMGAPKSMLFEANNYVCFLLILASNASLAAIAAAPSLPVYFVF